VKKSQLCFTKGKGPKYRPFCDFQHVPFASQALLLLKNIQKSARAKYGFLL
jgi:hypothetical protein